MNKFILLLILSIISPLIGIVKGENNCMTTQVSLGIFSIMIIMPSVHVFFNHSHILSKFWNKTFDEYHHFLIMIILLSNLMFVITLWFSKCEFIFRIISSYTVLLCSIILYGFYCLNPSSNYTYIICPIVFWNILLCILALI